MRTNPKELRLAPDAKISKAEYEAELHKAWLIAHMVDSMSLKTMLHAMPRSEGLAPFLDPTLWMQNREKFLHDKRMIEALSAFQMAMDRLLEREVAEAPVND